jgi:hypothetical protein
MDYRIFAKAVAQFAGRGVIGDGYQLLINTIHTPDMSPDFNTGKVTYANAGGRNARIFTNKEEVRALDVGTEEIKFRINDVSVVVKPSEYCKEGVALMINPELLVKVRGGDGDMKFEELDGAQRYLRMLEKKNAYMFRLFTDSAIFSPEPAKHIAFTGLTPAS